MNCENAISIKFGLFELSAVGTLTIAKLPALTALYLAIKLVGKL